MIMLAEGSCQPCSITRYGSTVYIGIAMSGPALFSFHFQFQSQKDIKVENVQKSNCMQKSG